MAVTLTVRYFVLSKQYAPLRIAWNVKVYTCFLPNDICFCFSSQKLELYVNSYTQAICIFHFCGTTICCGVVDTKHKWSFRAQVQIGAGDP